MNVFSKILFVLVVLLTPWACGVKTPPTTSDTLLEKTTPKETFVHRDYPIQPLPFTEVRFSDEFWAPRLLTHKSTTLSYTLEQCEETGRINNFRRAAGQQEGSFCTKYPFDDSDVFKILEGAAYALQLESDPVLEARVDSIIGIIAAAQEEDGYLYSNRTIDPDSAHQWAGNNRWELTHDLSHELYNVGHLYEAAAAHYWATGKKTLLNVALKNADLVDQEFGWGKIERPAGHQVIEIGLAKLYRITGKDKYLKLAQFFLDVRGPNGSDYSQAHAKVIDQSVAVGHAVRATYMYAGMADIAALTGNEAYVSAIDRIWNDVVSKKLYVTGGIGSTGDNEGFAEAYHLPNAEAYCETCASIANVFWNHRLFLMHGHSKYIDVLEKTLYNALSSGLALSGDRFFYPNVLEAQKDQERSPWFNCACCPSNIARFIPSIPSYQYAYRKDEVFFNLYVGGTATLPLESGELTLKQETRYPWDGQIDITVESSKQTAQTFKFRIPGWTQNQAIPSDLYRFMDRNGDQIRIKINDLEVDLEIEDGYATINRPWSVGDKISLYFPMPVRRVLAHPEVKNNTFKAALQRGPLMYCLEGKDQANENVLQAQMDVNAPVRSSFQKDLLQGVQTIQFQGSLFREEANSTTAPPNIQLKAIPYYAWANRGKDFMTVWIPYDRKGFNAPNNK